MVAATTTLPRTELRALEPGDVLLAGGALGLRGGALAGRVLLVAPRSERGVACDLADGERLVLRGEAADCPWTAADREPPMTSTSSPTVPTPASSALEEAPVVLRVEIGVVEMTARAWSELGAGDVLTLGVRVGEAAVLRAGGVEVARGELVQVEGEVGVRIPRGAELQDDEPSDRGNLRGGRPRRLREGREAVRGHGARRGRRHAGDGGVGRRQARRRGPGRVGRGSLGRRALLRGDLLRQAEHALHPRPRRTTRA